MHLAFDENSFLLPTDEPILMDLEHFEAAFVADFPKSQTRRVIFENYLEWLDGFRRDVFPFFEQWLDRSFLTRKLDPKDLDFVTFLDGRVHDLRKYRLATFLSGALERKMLDSYIVSAHELGHQDFEVTRRNREKFRTLFSETKPTKTGEQKPKGFIKMIFEK